MMLVSSEKEMATMLALISYLSLKSLTKFLLIIWSDTFGIQLVQRIPYPVEKTQ